MKPITYWIDNDQIKCICRDHGNRLENLTAPQKFELIGFLSLWVATVLNGEQGDDEDVSWGEAPIQYDPDDEVADILEQCSDFDPGQVGDFISAIADTIK
jgi:hypothetical protein